MPTFDKRVSLGNILTILAIIAAVIGGYYDLRNQIALAEQANKAAILMVEERTKGMVAASNARIDQQQVTFGIELRAIRDSLDRIDRRLSRREHPDN